MAVMRFGRAPEVEDVTGTPEWCEELARNARLHGASPYVVEGFEDITSAVRRGHAVLIRRERVEVADGVTVFDDAATPVTGPFADHTGARAEPIVAILRFDIGSARFVLQDAASPTGAVQLTPRRLANYLDDPERCFGVALGA